MLSKETKKMSNGYTMSLVLCRVDKGWEANYVKTRWIQLIAGFTMFALCISVCTTTTDATVFWEDDFSDPNLPGWTIFAWESTESLVKIEGNFSAADGTLKVLDDDLNYAWHNSTVNVGTWSFDMFVPDIGAVTAVMYVYIMSNGSRPIPNYPSDFIAVGAWRQSSVGNLHFIVWTMNGLDHIIHSHIYKDPMQGWHHIDISRASDGYFEVYFNGTFEDNFFYNDVTISTYLEFYCYNAAGAAIDNLVVNDTVIDPNRPTTTTTTTTTSSTTAPPPLPWIPLAVGGGVTVAVIVLVIVFLRRK